MDLQQYCSGLFFYCTHLKYQNNNICLHLLVHIDSPYADDKEAFDNTEGEADPEYYHLCVIGRRYPTAGAIRFRRVPLFPLWFRGDCTTCLIYDSFYA